MKNNTFFKLFIIIFIGISLRVWFLDKPHGLWNDEYVSWFIASQDSFTTFWNNMITNCHTPFYYIYLKIWMIFFSDSDISLRYSSVIPSICSIPIMYLIGKEFFSKKLGILCALFTSISSFCIYFAQEARPYSLLFLISSGILYFFVKISKQVNKNDFILYFLLNGLLCFTHTLGIIFAVFNILFLLLYLKKENKLDCCSSKNIIIYSIPFVFLTIIVSPLLLKIATSNNLSQFWSNISISKIICNFIDYFSPIITNLQSTQDNFLSYIFENNRLNYIFILFGLVPTIISLFLVIKAIQDKNKILNYLSLSCLCFFLTLIVLSLFGKMILVTKYSIEIYPVLLLLVSYGIVSLKKEKIKNIIIVILVGLNLFYIAYGADSAPKRTRAEGHLSVANLLKESKLTQNDYVILTYYGPEKFYRYIGKDDYKFSSINKFNFNYFLFNDENYFDVIKNGKYKYKSFFEEQPNKTIKKYTYDNFLSKMKAGDRLGIVVLNNVSFINNDGMKYIVNNQDKYENTPFIFLVFSTLRNELLNSVKQELTLDSLTQDGDWTLYVYIKNN